MLGGSRSVVHVGGRMDGNVYTFQRACNLAFVIAGASGLSQGRRHCDD